MKSFKKALMDLLGAAGCYYVRPAKGSHEFWYSPITDKHFVVCDTKSRHTANETLKQAGLPKAF